MMKNKTSLLQSAGIFSGAFFLAASVWLGCIYTVDNAVQNGRAFFQYALLLSAVCALTTLLWRRAAAARSRITIAIVSYLLVWLFSAYSEVVPTAFWRWMAAAMALTSGAGLGIFLRGARANRVAAAAGGVALTGAVALLTQLDLWQWWQFFSVQVVTGVVVDWRFLTPLCGLCLLAWGYPAGKLRWGLVYVFALLAGVFYLQLFTRALNETAATPQEIQITTVDGTRVLVPNEGGSGGDAYTLGGEWLASYPVDFLSRPAALPSVLQFTNHNLLILTVTQPFSIWPQELARYSWVARIDALSDDPQLARINGRVNDRASADIHYIKTLSQLGDPYDLIVVTVGDPERWISHLAPQGVLAVTPYNDRPELRERLPYHFTIPGPGLITLYSRRPLESDMAKLDENMLRAAMGVVPFQLGVLDVLYNLPGNSYPDFPEQIKENAVRRWPQAAFAQLPWQCESFPVSPFLMALGGLAALRAGRFLLTRRSHWYIRFGDIDAGFSAGTGIALLWLIAENAGLPLWLQAAAPGVACAMFLPHAAVTKTVRGIYGAVVYLAPLACALAWNWHAPWFAGIFAATTVAALNYWLTGEHSSFERFAICRVFLGFCAAMLLGWLLLNCPGGLWLFAAAQCFWRRLPF